VLHVLIFFHLLSKFCFIFLSVEASLSKYHRLQAIYTRTSTRINIIIIIIATTPTNATASNNIHTYKI